MRQFWLVCSVISLTGAIAGNVTATRSVSRATPPAAPPSATALVLAPASTPPPAERPTAAVWRWQPADPDRSAPRRWNRYDRSPSGTWRNGTWRNWRPRLPPSGASGFAWRRPFYDRRYSGYAYPSPPRWSDRFAAPPPRQYRRANRNPPDRYAFAGRIDDRFGRRWVWSTPPDQHQR